MMFVLMVIFLTATAVLVTGGVLFGIGTIQTNPPMDTGSLLIIGVMLPTASFVGVLYTIKCIFFNYHELTDRELVVSAPPFRARRVPLEEIVEIETDTAKIKASLGESMDVKYRETGGSGFAGGRFKFYGVSITHIEGREFVTSVFGSKNLVLIRAKGREIVTNVPNVKEFVDLVSKAIQKRKSELKV
jgi:hypothetical protein